MRNIIDRYGSSMSVIGLVRGRPSTGNPADPALNNAECAHPRLERAIAGANRRRCRRDARSRQVSGMTRPDASRNRAGPRSRAGHTAAGPVARHKRGKRVGRDLLVHMHRLGMLPEIVEPRKEPAAVASERLFAGVLAKNRRPSLAGGYYI